MNTDFMILMRYSRGYLSLKNLENFIEDKEEGQNLNINTLQL